MHSKKTTFIGSRTRLNYLMLCVFFLLLSNANGQALKSERLRILTSINYRQQDFKWSIAGNLEGKNPNIYSELTWKNLAGPRLDIDFKYKLLQKVYLRTAFSYSFIVSGSVTDTDYAEDNRTQTVFYADLQSDKGSSFAISPSLGYGFNVTGRIQISPFVGYGVRQQKFYLLDNENEGLKSTYQSFWKGPFIFLDTDFQVSQKINIEGNIAYHQVNYLAKANWNMIEAFQHPVSFRHKAKGYGIETDMKLGMKVSRSIVVFLSGKFFKWSTGEGVDELYLASGKTALTKFNDATLKGFSAGSGVKLLW